MYFSVAVLVLTKALFTELCDTLNVTVNPGPVVMVNESHNLTLSCLVSQRKRSSGVLVLRWLFSPPAAVTPSPLPSPPTAPLAPSASEVLIVRMGIKKMKLYGNYTRRFPQPKFRLHEERAGEVYRLLIVNVTGEDRGFYTCRVQEIRRHRNTWRASSNGSSSTVVSVHYALEDGSREGVMRLFADVYLCAVLICSLGLLSIFLFTLVLSCQHLHRRNSRLKASYLLVKCPESSSGETVTGSTSSSCSSPGAQRREARQAPYRKARPKATQMPTHPEEMPPHTPTKGPVATQKPRKPRRLKTQSRRSNTKYVYQDDSLTYAELELTRPRPEPPVSPSPDTTDTSTDTVYAQILFQEKQL